MEKHVPVNIVSSSKCYRPMFDAQAQVVKQLQEVEKNKGPPVIKENLIPLVHKDVSSRLLDINQESWCHALSNDANTGNPILFKQFQDFVNCQFYIDEDSVCKREVLHLPDIITPVKESSGIIEKIQLRRLERHEKILDDMTQQLALIKQKTEPAMNEILSTLRLNLEMDEKYLREFISKKNSDNDLQRCSRKNMDDVVQKTRDHGAARLNMISEELHKFSQLELDKINSIRNIFNENAVMLKKVAYLSSDELYRFLDRESKIINETFLSNKRAVGQLKYELSYKEIERQKGEQTVLRNRVKVWKTLKIQKLINEFKEFMRSDQVRNAKDVMNAKTSMIDQLSRLNLERMELLKWLLELRPPDSTKSAVYKWFTNMTGLCNQIRSTGQKHVDSLNLSYQSVSQLCLGEIDRIKKFMLQEEIASETEVNKLISKHFFPIAGNLQKQFEYEMEKLDNHVEMHNNEMNHRIKLVYRYSQGIAHVWDNHQVLLSKRERFLKKQSDDLRAKHDVENKDIENQLNILLDKLRQESKVKALDETLDKCSNLLSKLRECYDSAHQAMCLCVAVYPGVVEEEIEKYENNICLYFGLHKFDAETADSHMLEAVNARLKCTEINDGEQSANLPPVEGDLQEHVVDSVNSQETEITQFTSSIEIKLESRPSQPWNPDVITETLRNNKSNTNTQKGVSVDNIVIKKPLQTFPADEDDSMFTANNFQHLRDYDEIILNKAPSLAEEKYTKPSVTVYKDTAADASDDWDEIVVTDEKMVYFVLTEDQLRSSVILPQSTMVNDTTNVARETQLMDEDTSFKSYILTEDLSDDDQESQAPRPAYVGDYLKPVEYDDTPDQWYLTCQHLREDLMLSIKKKIRLNFVNFLDHWRLDCVNRAKRVQAAKTDELCSEYDLRLHMHAPRYSRIQQDIRNVRAAELALHSQRVDSHTRGVTVELDQLKDAFTRCMDDHQQLLTEFKGNINVLENRFINSTKSSQLVALQNQVGVELKQFMETIRISLRELRKYVEDNLQTLRDSSAHFMKSFRLFSDGGNFSRQELDDYRKKLEATSRQIDKVEGSLMHDLEGVESKRLEQATKLASEFENKFKYHMLDLLFMEKVARWLTNTQVHIKAEVSKSNEASRSISKFTKTLVSHIDACSRPNPDKEQITAEKINASLPKLFYMLEERANYLDCFIIDDIVSYIQEVQPSTSKTVNFGNVGGVTKQTTTGGHATSRSAKLTIDDPAIGIIKNILSTEKHKPEQQEPVQQFKLESRFRLSQSGQNISSSVGEVSEKSRPKTRAVNNGPSVSDVSIKSRWDQRFLVFGEVEDDRKVFLSFINNILKRALDGLLTISDMYYKQKGSRQVTRPHEMQDNFERHCEILITKLLSYQKQSQVYHNNCIIEFRGQVSQLENVVNKVPPLVISEIMKGCMAALSTSQQLIRNEFDKEHKILDEERERHTTELRPTLGHPQKLNDLDNLCLTENNRQNKTTELITEFSHKIKKDLEEKANEFLKSIVDCVNSQLLLYDTLVVDDDLQRGQEETKRYETSELLRKKKQVDTNLEKNDENIIRGPSMWPGLPVNELVLNYHYPDKLLLSNSCQSQKMTLAHKATIDARDLIYKDYKERFRNNLSTLDKQINQLSQLNNHWDESWKLSVKRVQQLY